MMNEEDNLWCNYSGMPSPMSYMKCYECNELTYECKCKEKTMNKEQQQIIDEVYERYSITAGMSTQVVSLTKDSFIHCIKTDVKFSETWGLKINERELSLEERKELMVKYTSDNSLLPIGFSVPFGDESNKKYLKVCDSYNIPTRLITLTYNNEQIENYE